MSIDSMYLWHLRARPEPTSRDFDVQLGCHLEEVAEMMETLTFHVDGHSSTAGEMTMLYAGLKLFADTLKSGEASATISGRRGLIDSLADQVVTSVGVARCANMSMPNACIEVDRSNWSKFDDNGQPIFDANGKIAKGPNYRAPDLTGMY